MSEKREAMKNRIETFKKDVFPVVVGAVIGAGLVAISYGGAYYGAKEGAQKVKINIRVKRQDGSDLIVPVGE